MGSYEYENYIIVFISFKNYAFKTFRYEVKLIVAPVVSTLKFLQHMCKGTEKLTREVNNCPNMSKVLVQEL